MEEKNKIESEAKTAKKGLLSSFVGFLFKEPRRNEEGKFLHFIRKIGRIIFVSSLLVFIISIFSANSQIVEQVFRVLFIPFIISFFMWKGDNSRPRAYNYRNRIGLTNHHSSINSSSNYRVETHDWTTDPSYSSTSGNIYN